MNDLILVDDNNSTNKLHKKLIEKSFKNINVVTFTSGKELIDYIFNEGCHLGKSFVKPLHILIDIAMPKLNGIDTLSMIKQRDVTLFRELSISVLSGNVNLKDELLPKSLSMINFIQKPLKIDILNRILEKSAN